MIIGKLTSIFAKTSAILNINQLLALLFLVITKLFVTISIGFFFIGIAEPTFLSYAKGTLTAAGIAIILCLYCGLLDIYHMSVGKK